MITLNYHRGKIFTTFMRALEESLAIFVSIIALAERNREYQ